MTDRRADGRTDGRTEAIAISPMLFLKKRGDNYFGTNVKVLLGIVT